MSDTCPRCGYCPTCKRANPATAPLFPAQYRCTCGAYVTAGTYHVCRYSALNPWPVTATSGTTTTLDACGSGSQNTLPLSGMQVAATNQTAS